MVKIVGNKAEFDEVLASAGDKAVVVDFYATWCGPCKVIAPYYEELSKQFTNVVFIKVDVDENEEVASSAGISAMPTFQVYKNGKKVGELMGAAKDKLLALVEAHK
ncbi:thioredoxin [Nannochloropsis oceanica]